MSEPTRLDFMVYYRKQLQVICDKLDREIERAGVKNSVKDKNLGEDAKDLTDPKTVEALANYPALIEVFEESRKYLKSISNVERVGDGLLMYTSKRHGHQFAMMALSPKHLNLYFAPRLGLYSNLPEEATMELRFGKSQGDRWDKFVLTSKFQLDKALGYLKPFLEPAGEDVEDKTEAASLK